MGQAFLPSVWATRLSLDPAQPAGVTSPAHVTVYLNLEWGRESLESLDVAGDDYEPAFPATGRVIRVEPPDDLFAEFEMTDQVDLERLRSLLREVRGPARLANDPSAYAQEWMRLEDLDAERPTLVPQRVWSWCRTKDRPTRQRSS